jgi:galactokinase
MPDARIERLAAVLGGDDLRFFRAPGRVNLIGGHVDYHEGWVVPMAIDRDIVVAARPRDDGRIVVRSLGLDGVVDVAADGSQEPRTVEPAWGRIVAAVARTLAAAGRPPVGADIAVASTLTIGGGLSSSAAFEVVVALVLNDVAEWDLPVRDLALATQAAEHLATGVPCGVQDQMAALEGVAGHALLLDCRTFRLHPLPIPASVAVLVVHSGVPRTLEGSPYASRRADSEAVAAKLGLRVLRDATPEQVAGEPRGRHAVNEMKRVLAFADALQRGDIEPLGKLMLEGHASLRDDMQVSTPELDALVECLVDAGALGARLTGGGFGGCVVALVPADRAREIATVAPARYRERTGREPAPMLVRAAAGAGPVAVGASGSTAAKTPGSERPVTER